MSGSTVLGITSGDLARTSVGRRCVMSGNEPMDPSIADLYDVVSRRIDADEYQAIQERRRARKATTQNCPLCGAFLPAGSEGACGKCGGEFERG